jgi:hypothetical protein
VDDGTFVFPGINLILESSYFEIQEAKILQHMNESVMSIKNMTMDASIDLEPQKPEEVIQMINDGVKGSMSPPITSFRVTNISLPRQNYKIDVKSMGVENWNKITCGNAIFTMKIEPGPLLDFKVGFSLQTNTVISAILLLDELMVPFSFEYDGKNSEVYGSSGFIACATLRTTETALIYTDTIGKYLSNIPKPLDYLKKTRFEISMLPSDLSINAQVKLVKEQNGYMLEFSQLDYSGNFNTRFRAEKIGLIELEVPFGADGKYAIRALKKLALRKKVEIKDTLEIESRILIEPFLSLESLKIPLGDVMLGVSDE